MKQFPTKRQSRSDKKDHFRPEVPKKIVSHTIFSESQSSMNYTNKVKLKEKVKGNRTKNIKQLDDQRSPYQKIKKLKNSNKITK